MQNSTVFELEKKEELKKELDQNQKAHLKRKDERRKLKYEAKRKAAEGPTFHFATFDLQSILQLPSDASPLYYMRKLIVYNLTFYDGVTGKGTCYLWTELDGKKRPIRNTKYIH